MMSSKTAQQKQRNKARIWILAGVATIALVLIVGAMMLMSRMSDGGDFVGLTEQQALQKAQNANITMRVVERDGVPLLATMDLREGRHNIYVANGKVYRMSVERL